MTLPLLRDDQPDAVPISLVRTATFAEYIAAQPPSVARQASQADFRGQAGKTLLILGDDGALNRALFGLGDTVNPMALGTLGKDLPPGAYRIHGSLEGHDLAQAATAFALGAYAYERFKPRKRAAPVLTGLGDVHQAASRIADAVYFARNLVNTPANIIGPEGLHAEAQDLGARLGAHFSAIVGDDLLKQNYPLIHAVGRAAREAPRLLHLTWGDKDAPRVALIGKGVCFDSGGLDIKNDAGMRLMKKDMGGAAVALGLLKAIADRGLPVRVDVWLPVVENAIGADAFRPGDVVVSRKGLSVEVDNTDAEGRLILADALTRAAEESPALALDFATLTGAARIALGQDLTPVFTDDEMLAADIAAASLKTGDHSWRLPLWDAYDAEMECMPADLKNAGDTGQAGSIIGALFLRRFAPKSAAWAHFDTYCWTMRERPGRPVGGDCQGLRAVFALLEHRYG